MVANIVYENLGKCQVVARSRRMHRRDSKATAELRMRLLLALHWNMKMAAG